jgi:hypothetical protein
MLFKDLENLIKETGGEGLYDLFIQTFKNNLDIPLKGYIVQREDEMRIDKISTTLYGSSNNASFLLNLNNIKNPLTIKQGEILLYVDVGQVRLFEPDKPVDDAVRKDLINNNKAAKKDANRKEYLDTNQADALPVTIKKSSIPNVTVDDQKAEIILGSASASERPTPKTS